MINQEDPRVLRTRNLIIVAFRELLLIKGFDEITIKDISQKATINRATFYSHFEDKYDLLDKIAEQVFRGMFSVEIVNAQGFTEEVCEQIILQTYTYIVEFYHTCRRDSHVMYTLVDKKMRYILEQTIEDILLKDSSQKNQDRQNISLMAVMAGSAIYGAAQHWYNVEGQFERVIPVDFITSYVMSGLKLYHTDNK